MCSEPMPVTATEADGMMRTTNPSVTFVTCIEAGPLESQVIRMADSLRRWGGRFRNCSVLAVRPRFGPPLAASTMRSLESAGVTYHRAVAGNPYPWFGYLNKPAALIEAEALSESEVLVWLDGDVLIIDEPNGFELASREAFAACVRDKNIGFTGPGDPHEAYWRAASQSCGLELEALPWVTTCREGASIRLYWNSGVFAYRRQASLGAAWMEACQALLHSRVMSHASRTYFTDQVALPLAVTKAGLNWRSLPYAYNYGVGRKIVDCINPQGIQAARVLHYHDSMYQAFWVEFLRILGDSRPDVRDWLAPMGSLDNRRAVPWKVLAKALNVTRNQRLAKFEATCCVV